MQRTLEEELGILRVTIETQLGAAALIVVTSATADDGAEEIALGISRSFAAAGRRSALVPIGHRDVFAAARDAQTVGMARTLAGMNVRCDRFAEGLDVISLPSDGVPSSKAMSEFAHDIRYSYDATIIEPGVVTMHGAALQLASIADAVLLTVRLGRPQVEADRAVMPLLARVGARVVGTVTTTAAARRRVRAEEAAASTVLPTPAAPEAALQVAAKF